MKRFVVEEHHRRPRSLGGADKPPNISFVPHRLHRHWHTLFGNLNAEQTCNKINLSPWKPRGVTLVCHFINGTEVAIRGKHDSVQVSKCQLAWYRLFGRLAFRETINYINNVWLDPSYHFYIVR